MISDVLFDAVKQIERYEAEMPETYGTMREEIQRAKDAMQALQRKLDAPPQYNKEEGAQVVN